MGLDWMLQAHTHRPGCEKQYRRIKAKLEALAEDEKLAAEQKEKLQKDLTSALKLVAVSPFEVIGAPQVGIDQEATAWFKREVFEPNQQRVAAERKKATGDRMDRFIAFWARPFDQVVADEHGKYVVELAKEPEGVAAISGMLCTALDFRGKAVVLSVVVTEDLRNEAFDNHDADECVDYADRLQASLAEYKVEHPDWETRHEKNTWGGLASARDDAQAIEVAAKWLRFWGGRGFGYSAWY
jgi:hypothetical protein